MDKPYNTKIKYMNTLNEAYEVLIDYHSRRNLDNYLDRKSSFGFFDDFFPFRERAILPKINFDSIEKSNNGNKYYYSSNISINSTTGEKGNTIKNHKSIINDNGKKKTQKHTITNIDKDGNEIIQTTPINKKKINYK